MICNSESSFSIEKLIKKGTFGSIHLVRDSKTNKQFIFKKANSFDKNEHIQTEKEILNELKSEYIVKYFGSFIQKNGLHTLVLEYIPNDLRSIIQNTFFKSSKNKIELKPYNKKKILFQILKGIDYIHENFITHNDLKPENILVDSSFNVKICDFGTATNIKNKIDFKKLFTSPKYESPERLLGTRNREDLCPSDIWSFGCIVIELLTGTAPFDGINKIDQILNIFKIVGTPVNEDLNYLHSLPSISETGVLLPSFVSKWDCLKFKNKEDEYFLELIKSSLNPCSKKRITAKKALELKVFSDFHKN